MLTSSSIRTLSRETQGPDVPDLKRMAPSFEWKRLSYSDYSFEGHVTYMDVTSTIVLSKVPRAIDGKDVWAAGVWSPAAHTRSRHDIRPNRESWKDALVAALSYLEVEIGYKGRLASGYYGGC